MSIVLFQRNQQSQRGGVMRTRELFNITSLTLGFMVSLSRMVLLVSATVSNSSKLVTVWAVWSTKWYGEVAAKRGVPEMLHW